MRLVLHDYSGHAFLVQLARQLARDGNDVLYLHFPGFQTPKGALLRRPDDPPSLEIRGLSLPEAFAKYSYVKRLSQEFAYGRRLARAIAACPALRLRGWMAVPPASEDPEASRPYFRQLHAWRDDWARQDPTLANADLSMGMSNDFEVAIEEGATLVRVGTALFGPRVDPR